VTPDEALLRIGESTAAAVVATLGMFCPDGVEAGAPVALPRESDPVAGLALPAVMAQVSYVDGVTGGNLFCMPLAGARTLAAAMMGEEPDPGADPDALTELELSAVGEATNQMMAAAAAATTTVLGQEVEIDAPQVRVAAVAADAAGVLHGSDAVVAVPIEILGHSCRLIQMVPHAFVVRMTRALDEMASEYAPGDLADGTHDGPLSADALGDIQVRVWAELGRARMPIRQAIALARGAVVDLDRALEEPIDLYVNGRRFATGRLVTVDESEWAVQIDTVAHDAPQPTPTQGDR
jgi:flagellar motor switch protein FliN/FliY